MKGKIKQIDYKQAKEFLLPKHYSGRIPSISYAYGWFFGETLKAVVTFGKPASNSLCKGVCGEQYSSIVYELNRLCRTEDLEEPLSYFVAKALRELSKIGLIIVSYSDTAMNHNGYIYQACNFLYTGATARRTDKYTEGNKHSRHYDNDKQNGLRKVRSSKHRYIYIAVRNKRKRREILDNLNYKIQDYPKGENSNYELGNYLKPEIIRSS